MAFGSVKELNDYVANLCKSKGLVNQVAGDGDINAKIVIIGEAPGEAEVAAGLPFVGGSGNELFQTLVKQCNVRRQDCYITNVSKMQLTMRQKSLKEDDNNPDAEKVYLNKDTLYAYQFVLQQELAALPNAKYFLLLGNMALQAMTGNLGVAHWRGSVLEVDRGIALVTFNPAMIFREPKYRPVFGLDLHKFNRVLKGTYKEHTITHHINPTFRQAWDYLHHLQVSMKPISFDIEVVGIETDTQAKLREREGRPFKALGETACVGLTNDPHEGMCINWRTDSGHQFTIEEEMKLRLKMQHVLSQPYVRLVAQNGNFDSYWLWFKDRIRVQRLWFDTMLAHHTMYSTLPHSLAFLTSQYTDHPYYKDDGKFWKEGNDIDVFWRYNVKDVCITLACQRKLEEELKLVKLDSFFFDHVMKLNPHLTKMTVLGVKCDMALKDKVYEEVGIEVDMLKQEFWKKCQEATGDPTYKPNPNSTLDKTVLFYNRLGLPKLSKNGSTDAKAREALLASPSASDKAKDVIIALNRYVTEHKFFSTYVKMDVDEDGRVRCDYKQTGVQSAPGRLSSAATMWGSGTNLQNQPTRAQHMFIADEGYEFTYTDGSQAEARVVAVIADVKALKENFERAKTEKGFDVHRGNAARIFRKPYEEIPSYDRDPVTDAITMRFLGKRCVHGLNYRMAPEKLAEVCGIPIWQATMAYGSYHRAFPEIKQWWAKTMDYARRHRYLLTPLGRRLNFLGVDFDRDTNALDAAVAFVPQATVGDWVAGLIYKCQNDPDWPRTARMALNVHDALIALNRIEDGATVRAIMKHYAEQPIMFGDEPIYIPFEFKHSVPGEDGLHRWSKLEKVKD